MVLEMVNNWKSRVFDSESTVDRGSLHSAAGGQPRFCQCKDCKALWAEVHDKAVFGGPVESQKGGIEIQPGMILFSNKTPCSVSRVEIGSDGRPERRRI